MIREHWREPRFWLWWFRRGGPPEVRLIAGLFALAVALAGGFLAAARLSQAGVGVSSTSGFTFVTTVQQDVTVRQGDTNVVRRVPVVRRVVVRPQTRYETQLRTRVVTTSGDVRLVKRYVPVLTERVVTVRGPGGIKTETVLGPTARTQTQTITNAETVVNHDTSTVLATVPVTISVREPTTVVSTQTLSAEIRTITHFVTVTQPAVTVPTPVVTVTVPVPTP